MEQDLYPQICSINNLNLAYKKARKGKTLKPYVLNFEENLDENILQLETDLLFHSYQPKPLQQFILRDPKTRKINRSAFRDRIVHHAICNIIAPLFEKTFIYDSYANRKGKGVLKAIERFERFQRKVSHNNTRDAYVFKADIRKYFEAVDKSILLAILKKKIKCPKTMWLIKKILSNYSTQPNKGMPLGNLISQFFANVYLNELDQFVKHKLKVKYYLRYVDDFVILHQYKDQLIFFQNKIDYFLHTSLKLQLHPDKSKIFSAKQGTEFLGMDVFPRHRSLKRKNLLKFKRKYTHLKTKLRARQISYDQIYDFIEGWLAYARNANTYTLCHSIISAFELDFSTQISSKQIHIYSSKTIRKPIGSQKV